jgi:hypothetical protein
VDFVEHSAELRELALAFEKRCCGLDRHGDYWTGASLLTGALRRDQPGSGW